LKLSIQKDSVTGIISFLKIFDTKAVIEEKMYTIQIDFFELSEVAFFIIDVHLTLAGSKSWVRFHDMMKQGV
jgi:Holliday junction resolvase